MNNKKNLQLKVCKWFYDTNINPADQYWYESCHETCKGNDTSCGQYNPIPLKQKKELLATQYSQNTTKKILDKIKQ